tara:strand:+ start:16350 stop:20897 length:4548 start_codon:yes stop_codon:yes gene_type:complete
MTTIIRNDSELIAYILKYNAGTPNNVELASDIYFEDTTISIPLGNDIIPFNNKFDGMGFTIYNLQINSFKNVGFIGVLGHRGEIKQVNFDISGHRTVPYKIKSNSLGVQYGCGIVVGKNQGGCIRYVKVSGNYSVEGNWNVGGICGYNKNIYSAIQTIQFCSIQITNDIIGKNNVGGVIGKNERSAMTTPGIVTQISNLSQNSNIRGMENVGGLIGHNLNMDVSTCNVLMEGNIISHFNAGGAIGKHETTLSNELKGGKIRSVRRIIVSLIGNVISKENTGGIVGYNKGAHSEIIDCVNSINGNIDYRRNAGGIVGRNNGRVYECQNLMNGNIENGKNFEQYYNVILSTEDEKELTETITRKLRKELIMKAVNSEIYDSMTNEDVSVHNFYDHKNDEFKTYKDDDTFKNNKYNYWVENPSKFKKINANEFYNKKNYKESGDTTPSETRNSFYKYEIDKDNEVYKDKKTIDIEKNAKFSFGVAHKEDWYFSNKSNIEINRQFSYLVNADRLRSYLKEDNRECLKMYKEKKFVFDNNIHHWITSLFQLIKDLRHPDGLIGLHNRYGGITNVANTINVSNHSLAILPISRLDQTRIDAGDQQLSKLSYDEAVGAKERQNYNNPAQGFGGEAQNFDVQTRNDDQMFYWQIPFRLSYNFNTTNPFLDVRTIPSKNFIGKPKIDYNITNKPEKRFIYLKDYNAWNLSGNPKYGSRYHGILPSVKQGVETRMTGVKGRFIPRSPIEQDLSYLCKLQEQIDSNDVEVITLGKKYGLDLSNSFHDLSQNFTILYNIFKKDWNTFLVDDSDSPMYKDKIKYSYHENKLKGYSNNLNVLSNEHYYYDPSYSIVKTDGKVDSVNSNFEEKALVAGLANILYLQFLSIGPTWHILLYDTEGMYDRLKKIEGSPADPFQNFIKLNLQTDCDPYMFPFELQQRTNNFNTLPHAVFNSKQFVTNQPVTDAYDSELIPKIKHDIDNNWWSDETLSGSNKYSYSFEAAYNLFYYMTEDNIFLDISKNSQPKIQSKVWRLNPSEDPDKNNNYGDQEPKDGDADVKHTFWFDGLITKRLELFNEDLDHHDVRSIQYFIDRGKMYDKGITLNSGGKNYDLSYILFPENVRSGKAGMGGFKYGTDDENNETNYNNISYSVVPNNYLLNKLWNRTIFRRDVEISNSVPKNFYMRLYNTLLEEDALTSMYDNISNSNKDRFKESLNVLKMPMGNINTYYCSSGIDNYFKSSPDSISNEIAREVKSIFKYKKPNTNLKENPNSNYYISTVVNEVYEKYSGFNINQNKQYFTFLDYNMIYVDNYEDKLNNSIMLPNNYGTAMHISNNTRKLSSVYEYTQNNYETFKKNNYLNINLDWLIGDTGVLKKIFMNQPEVEANNAFNEYYTNTHSIFKLTKMFNTNSNEYFIYKNTQMLYELFYSFNKENQYYNSYDNMSTFSFYPNNGELKGDDIGNIQKYYISTDIIDGVIKYNSTINTSFIDKPIDIVYKGMISYDESSNLETVGNNAVINIFNEISRSEYIF